MPFSEKEMLEDLHKVRIRTYVYFLGGLGVLGLSVALLVLFFARHDWPALLLAAVGAFWSVVLLYHAYRTRQLGGLIGVRLAERRAAGGAGDTGNDAEGADVPAGGAPGEP